MVLTAAFEYADPVALDEEIIYDRTAAPLQIHVHKRTDNNDQDDNDGTIISDTSRSGNLALPRPFDTTLGNNFTSTQCLPFFQSFLSNPTFSACLPFSLLLQTSASFFQAMRDPELLTRTLDATCNVNVTDCSLLMSDLNAQLRAPNICGPDLSRQNPAVSQAAAGFAAYDTLYRAACTKTNGPASVASSSSSGASHAEGEEEEEVEEEEEEVEEEEEGKVSQARAPYCFAAAATNLSAPDSLYTYFVPMGMRLPPAARPACTDCLRDTMAGFAYSADIEGRDVVGAYAQAAETVNAWCGEGFAGPDVALASTAVGLSYSSAATQRGGAGWSGGAVGVVAAGVVLLLSSSLF